MRRSDRIETEMNRLEAARGRVAELREKVLQMKYFVRNSAERQKTNLEALLRAIGRDGSPREEP